MACDLSQSYTEALELSQLEARCPQNGGMTLGEAVPFGLGKFLERDSAMSH